MSQTMKTEGLYTRFFLGCKGFMEGVAGRTHLNLAQQRLQEGIIPACPFHLYLYPPLIMLDAF